MIKENGLLNKIFFVIILLISFSACKSEEFDIEQNNNLFFDSLQRLHQYKVIEVTDLSLNYYDQYYYYEVKFYLIDDEFHYHQLYEIHIDYLAHRIPLNNVDTSKELQDIYSPYLTDYEYAKENGISKIYTNEEIDALEEKYLNNAK